MESPDAAPVPLSRPGPDQVLDEAQARLDADRGGLAAPERHRGEAARRERWLRAGTEVTSRLLAGGTHGDALGLVAERAHEIGRAALAVAAVPVAHGGSLAVELAVGTHARAHRGLVLPCAGTFMGAALRTAAPVVSSDISGDVRAAAGPEFYRGLGPAVAVPACAGGRVRGVVLLARERGGARFTPAERELLTGLAGQAAVAIELDERRHHAERARLLKERDRIARDLHDQAIQRLFATGMTLQGASRLITDPDAAERVLRAVDDLDETIRIIRSTVFGLRCAHDTTDTHLRTRVVRAAAAQAQALGFAPRVRMEGMLDTRVPQEVAEHTVAVLCEALSNVARHASATRVDVHLDMEGDGSGDHDGSGIHLTVRDNGRGIPPGARRSGLRNLAQRAEELGGTLDVRAVPAGGTSLIWHVPVRTGGGANA